MPSEPQWSCVRCGHPVHKRGSACRSCLRSDPEVAKAMSANAQADLARREAKRYRYLRPSLKVTA